MKVLNLDSNELIYDAIKKEHGSLHFISIDSNFFLSYDINTCFVVSNVIIEFNDKFAIYAEQAYIKFLYDDIKKIIFVENFINLYEMQNKNEYIMDRKQYNKEKGKLKLINNNIKYKFYNLNMIVEKQMTIKKILISKFLKKKFKHGGGFQ